MKKWNFDFKREIPLSGRYEWQKVDEHGNEISNSINSINLVNEEQNRNEEEEQTEETERNARRRSDAPMDENATKRAKLEES